MFIVCYSRFVDDFIDSNILSHYLDEEFASVLSYDYTCLLHLTVHQQYLYELNHEVFVATLCGRILPVEVWILKQLE
jgi:hypothetical protein